MADIIKQIQDSIENMLDQDFFPDHLRGRKLSELTEDELYQAKHIINNHTERLKRQAEEPARQARHEKMKQNGEYAHSWFVIMNTKTTELLEAEAARLGVKADGWVINKIIEQHFNLQPRSSIPKGYNPK